MKKIISILIAFIIIIYIVVEFIGDSIIKGSLESNLSNSLGRDIKIESLSIGYLNGKAEIENLQVSSKGPGDFVSSADKRTEKILIEELNTHHISGYDQNYIKHQIPMIGMSLGEIVTTQCSF